MFGPFRLDATQRVLTRDGVPVALTPTVFDTLVHLVENSGRPISREELLDAIWPGRRVEESNITQTIFTLRRALNDGAGRDRLIVTVPGRGYRFTAPMNLVPGRALGAGLAIPAPRLPPPRPRRRLTWILAAVGAAMVILGGLAIVLHPWRPAASSRTPALVVLGQFQNLTAEPIFDRTLAKALEIDLDQSPFVGVLPQRQVEETLLLMTRPRDQLLTPAIAGEVCARNAGRAVVEGSIAALGANYLLTLTATDCTGGRVLAAEKTQVDGREAVIPALDRLIGQMRGRLGEPPASIAKFDVPLAQERTSSLAALKAFSEASDMAGRGRRLDSMALLQHAVDLDPQFAGAWAGLAAVHFNLDQKDAAIADIARAYALRGAVNEREKLHIVTLYAIMVTRDLDQSLRAAREWTQIYPRDFRAWVDLANAEDWLGRWPASIEAGRRALDLNADAESSYATLAAPLMRSGRLDEAAAICARAMARGRTGEQSLGLALQVASARDDTAGVARLLALARGKPPEIHLLALAARDAYRRGQVAAGDALYAHAADLARDQGLSDAALAPRAQDLADLGLTVQARALAGHPADTADQGPHLVTLAMADDPGQARGQLDRALQAAPADTLLHAVIAPEARAALALRQGRAAEALAALQPAAPFEEADVRIPYLRGQADLAAADGPGAVRAFQSILDHPGVDPTSPLHALARLGLARAQRRAGKIEASRRAYQAFLAAWKTADPGLPPLIQARAEYAGL